MTQARTWRPATLRAAHSPLEALRAHGMDMPTQQARVVVGAQAGAPMSCEKPIAADLPAAQQMMGLCRAAGEYGAIMDPAAAVERGQERSR